MVLVVYLVMAWFSIHVLAGLRAKLPLCVNILLFMAAEIILTNKLTLLGFDAKRFIISQDIPRFLALIVHNDLTVTTVLLTCANAFLTAKKRWVRAAAFVYGAGLQLLLGMTLRWFGILKDNGWGMVNETIMVLLLTGFTLLAGTVFRNMACKEGWVR